MKSVALVLLVMISVALIGCAKAVTPVGGNPPGTVVTTSVVAK